MTCGSPRPRTGPRRQRTAEQDLLHPDRGENGYRAYGEAAVRDVQQIRGLLDPGLTTEMIRAILPHLSGPDEIILPAEHLTPETAACSRTTSTASRPASTAWPATATGSAAIWRPYDRGRTRPTGNPVDHTGTRC
ncbi:MerR family transcriptional regulator [Streptomyces sp. ID05-47C]|uniref:MerR family transcriptional regulator n=1 Tax=Streptomyces sp. ID05-47C TaxID=3028665 RepID=UPI0029A37433|nr:MerR family transcriptional regulator [Streptomyces sp. ID05-47C]MDX3572321.1 MerR family transcriptional regulator [Streptomyces sp. ID05-47C]